MFEPYHKLGHDAMCPSNYKVTVDAATCKGCALCVKRCPVDALQLKVSAEANNKVGKVAVVDSDLCVGCGVCVHKCPADSIVLVQNEEVVEPPETARDYGMRLLAQRQAAREEAEQT
jgi:Pyruvate/2-oxoacid:ferredoxin oxidoreductase delta subunit